jgi:hypothetical protein
MTPDPKSIRSFPTPKALETWMRSHRGVWHNDFPIAAEKMFEKKRH